MKNHQFIDGRLLQTNKKWSQLKATQKQWINEQIKIEHIKYVEQYNKLPMKKGKEKVFDAVWEKILKREIWIPYYEYKANAGKMIDRINRKNSVLKAPLNE